MRELLVFLFCFESTFLILVLHPQDRMNATAFTFYDLDYPNTLQRVAGQR